MYINSFSIKQINNIIIHMVGIRSKYFSTTRNIIHKSMHTY